MEEQYRKEREQYTQAFEKQKKVWLLTHEENLQEFFIWAKCIFVVIAVFLKEYENRIQNLQKQVEMANSMISSTYSNFTMDSNEQTRQWEFGNATLLVMRHFTHICAICYLFWHITAFIIEECKWTEKETDIVRRAFNKWKYHQFTSLRVSCILLLEQIDIHFGLFFTENGI